LYISNVDEALEINQEIKALVPKILLLKRLAIGEWPSRTLKVISVAAISR